MNSIRIKWIATQVGIEKLVLKQGKMIGYFVSDQQSDYYQSTLYVSDEFCSKTKFNL
jgi:transcription-repair coupling factor (superfamily II helicase)